MFMARWCSLCCEQIRHKFSLRRIGKRGFNTSNPPQDPTPGTYVRTYVHMLYFIMYCSVQCRVRSYDTSDWSSKLPCTYVRVYGRVLLICNCAYEQYEHFQGMKRYWGVGIFWLYYCAFVKFCSMALASLWAQWTSWWSTKTVAETAEACTYVHT